MRHAPARSTSSAGSTSRNNAGNFIAGFFQEISPATSARVETNLFPTERHELAPARVSALLVIATSSTGGIAVRSSAPLLGLEVRHRRPDRNRSNRGSAFGIHTVSSLLLPHDLLTPESTKYAEPAMNDYAERTRETVANWNSMNGKQGGDPAKLAEALIKLASQDEPPVRWVAGADAVETVENKGRDLIAQADAYRDVSSSLAHDD
jgi:hypothetical protein